MSYITVCTPTYNRAYVLKRPFESLQKQTFKDFEWLIIDDGSTDNTKELVATFKQQATFPITYVYQQNQGRAAALNTSYQYIKTKYVINLDSDDEYVPDALEKIHRIWESIPAKDYSRFWCITGQCIDSKTGKIIGTNWPKDINQYTGVAQYKRIYRYKGGEKSCCRKLEVLKKFPFPQYEDTKFVPENIVWEKINLYYDQFCTNEVFRIYYTDSSDSLSVGRCCKNSHFHSLFHYQVFLLNELWGRVWYYFPVVWALPNISRFAILSGRSFEEIIKELNTWYKKLLVASFYPAVYVYMHKFYKSRRP